MSKAKKVIEEAKQIQNPELDLVDKNVATFEEIPGIRKYIQIIAQTDGTSMTIFGNLLTPNW